MLRYVLTRLILLVPVLLGISLIVFLIMIFIPGDPAIAILQGYATAENVAKLRAELGLDRPLVEQYFNWLGNLLSGDFGRSYNLNRPVLDELLDRIVPTLILAGSAMLICVFLGLLSGLMAAVRQYSWVDQTLTVISLIGISAPSFWLALMAVAPVPERALRSAIEEARTLGIPKRSPHLFRTAAALLELLERASEEQRRLDLIQE